MDKVLHCCGSLAYGNAEAGLQLLGGGLVPRAVGLLQAAQGVKQHAVVTSAARALGNMCHGSPQLAVAVVSGQPGVLESLARLLVVSSEEVVKACLVALAHCTAGVPHHADRLLLGPLGPSLVEVLSRLLKRRGSEEVVERCAFLVANLAAPGTGHAASASQAALLQGGTSTLLPALVSLLLSSRSVVVLEKVVPALGALAAGNPPARLALASAGVIANLNSLLLAGGRQHALLVSRAVEGLASIGGEAPLVKLLAHKRLGVAEAAAGCLLQRLAASAAAATDTPAAPVSPKYRSSGGSGRQSSQQAGAAAAAGCRGSGGAADLPGRLVRLGAVPALLRGCALHGSSPRFVDSCAAALAALEGTGGLMDSALRDALEASDQGVVRTLACSPHTGISLLATNVLTRMGAKA